jgi:hypothetical protein
VTASFHAGAIVPAAARAGRDREATATLTLKFSSHGKAIEIR